MVVAAAGTVGLHRAAGLGAGEVGVASLLPFLILGTATGAVVGAACGLRSRLIRYALIGGLMGAFAGAYWSVSRALRGFETASVVTSALVSGCAAGLAGATLAGIDRLRS